MRTLLFIVCSDSNCTAIRHGGILLSWISWDHDYPELNKSFADLFEKQHLLGRINLPPVFRTGLSQIEFEKSGYTLVAALNHANMGSPSNCILYRGKHRSERLASVDFSCSNVEPNIYIAHIGRPAGIILGEYLSLEINLRR